MRGYDFMLMKGPAVGFDCPVNTTMQKAFYLYLANLGNSTFDKIKLI